jgi:hypothetical protein
MLVMNIYVLQIVSEFDFGQWIVTAPTEAEAKQLIMDKEKAWICPEVHELTCMYLAQKPFMMTAIVIGGHKNDG